MDRDRCWIFVAYLEYVDGIKNTDDLVYMDVVSGTVMNVK